MLVLASLKEGFIRGNGLTDLDFVHQNLLPPSLPPHQLSPPGALALGAGSKVTCTAYLTNCLGR